MTPRVVNVLVCMAEDSYGIAALQSFDDINRKALHFEILCRRSLMTLHMLKLKKCCSKSFGKACYNHLFIYGKSGLGNAYACRL